MMGNGVAPAPPAAPSSGWWSHLWTAISAAAITAITGLLFTPIASFAATQIANALNRQELRVSKIDSICLDLSVFLFEADNLQETLSRPVSLKASLDGPVSAYNNAITTLRSREYIDRATLNHYWGADVAKQYVEVLDQVKALDAEFHKATPYLETAMAASDGTHLQLGDLSNVTKTTGPLLVALKPTVEKFVATLVPLRDSEFEKSTTSRKQP